jgi:hypothetical protein
MTPKEIEMTETRLDREFHQGMTDALEKRREREQTKTGMVKNKSIHFRYDEDITRSIETIIKYIQEAAPGAHPTTSDAIRFALLTKAADIRMERSKGPPETFDGNKIESQWIAPK